MTLNEEAFLLVVKNNKGDNGFAVTEKQRIPIFVREKSVTRVEFYEALRSNIQVRTVLEAWQADWELSAHMVGKKKEYASQIEYDGSVYDIVRTYKSDKSLIEIVCS